MTMVELFSFVTCKI